MYNLFENLSESCNAIITALKLLKPQTLGLFEVLHLCKLNCTTVPRPQLAMQNCF